MVIKVGNGEAFVQQINFSKQNIVFFFGEFNVYYLSWIFVRNIFDALLSTKVFQCWEQIKPFRYLKSVHSSEITLPVIAELFNSFKAFSHRNLYLILHIHNSTGIANFLPKFRENEIGSVVSYNSNRVTKFGYLSKMNKLLNSLSDNVVSLFLMMPNHSKLV